MGMKRGWITSNLLEPGDMILDRMEYRQGDEFDDKTPLLVLSICKNIYQGNFISVTICTLNDLRVHIFRFTDYNYLNYGRVLKPHFPKINIILKSDDPRVSNLTKMPI